MAKPHPLPVKFHFVPLPAGEAADRGQRFRALLLRGAIRSVQKLTQEIRDQETAVPVSVVGVQK